MAELTKKQWEQHRENVRRIIEGGKQRDLPPSETQADIDKYLGQYGLTDQDIKFEPLPPYSDPEERRRAIRARASGLREHPEREMAPADTTEPLTRPRQLGPGEVPPIGLEEYEAGQGVPVSPGNPFATGGPTIPELTPRGKRLAREGVASTLAATGGGGGALGIGSRMLRAGLGGAGASLASETDDPTENPLLAAGVTGLTAGLGQGAGEAVAGLAPDLVRRLLRQRMGLGVRTPPQEVQAVAQGFAQEGAAAPLPALTDTGYQAQKAMKALERLSRSPGARARINRAANNALAAVHTRTLRTLGPLETAAEGGEVIKRAAQNASNRLALRTEKAIQGLGLSDETVISLPNTSRVLGGIETLNPLDPIAQTKNMLDEGSLNWGWARTLLQSARQLGKRENGAFWRSLEDSLLQDFERAAQAAGKTKEYARFKKAYDSSAMAEDTFLSRVATESNEQAFDTAMSASRTASDPTFIEQSAQRLRGIKRTLSEDEWQQLVGLELRRRATREGDEVFNSFDLLSTWNNIPQRIKDVMAKPGTQFRKDLDALGPLLRGNVQIARAETSREGTNFLRDLFGFGRDAGIVGALLTQNVNMGLRIGGLAVAGKVAASTAKAVSDNVMSRLMTNPKFLNWLVRGLRIEDGNVAKMAAHISRLGALAAEEPSLRGDVRALAMALRGYTAQ